MINLVLVTILSFLYSAYLIELYRYLTYPLQPLHKFTLQKYALLAAIFSTSLILTIVFAYFIRKLVLSPVLFDLIVASLQALFFLPFFGALVPDRLLYTRKNKRLPYSISLTIIISTGCIGAISNILLLLEPMSLIEKTTYIIEVLTVVASLCFVLCMTLLSAGYAFYIFYLQKH